MAIRFSSDLDSIIAQHLQGKSVNVHAELRKAEITKLELKIGWDDLKAEFDVKVERKAEDEIQQSQDVFQESLDRTWPPPVCFSPPRDAKKRKKNEWLPCEFGGAPVPTYVRT